MFKKILSIISVPFFCICLSACSFAGFNPLDKGKSDKINSLSEEQTEVSTGNTKDDSVGPVYRVSKEIWNDGSIIEYTYNQDGTLRHSSEIQNEEYSDGVFENLYDYYDNGCLKTIIFDYYGDSITSYSPNHLEIHCDKTGAFESIESSVDRELYIEKGVDIPVYEIEVTGEREFSIQGHIERDVNDTFYNKRKYNATVTFGIEWELEHNGQLVRRTKRIMNERGLFEKSFFGDEDSKTETNYIYINDINGNPRLCVGKYDDSFDLQFILFYTDITGTVVSSESTLDESNAKEFVEGYFNAVCSGDSQKAWDFVYRPLREYFSITQEQNEVVSFCDEGLLPEDEGVDYGFKILQCQKVKDIPLSELKDSVDDYFNNEFSYSKALNEMNGLRVTVDIFSTEDESVHETCNVYLVSDDAGEAGVFLITD